jgi:hypothetical protein
MVKALEGQGWQVTGQDGAEASLVAKKGAGRALVWLEALPQASETTVVMQIQGGG